MADYNEYKRSIIVFSGFSGLLWRYTVVIRYTGVTIRTPVPYGHRNGWSPEGPAPRGRIAPGRPEPDGSSMLSSPRGRTTPVRPPRAPPRNWSDSATSWRIAVLRFSTLRRRPRRPQRPPLGTDPSRPGYVPRQEEGYHGREAVAVRVNSPVCPRPSNRTSACSLPATSPAHSRPSSAFFQFG
jgi:hypothetical protein